MLTNYVFMIPIKSKNNEGIIKAYLKDVYSTFRGSTYILSDRGGEFTSTDWDDKAHTAAIVYNVFPHSSPGEASFYFI